MFVDRDIYAETDAVQETVVTTPVLVDEPVQKISSRKDNVLVRLKNRIKELEMNLSLSSQ